MVIVDGKRYRVSCGGLIGEGQLGVCVEFDVVGASAVVMPWSSAPCGRSGWVLIIGYFVVVRVGIIKSAWYDSLRECRVRVCGDGVFVRNYIFTFRRCECI